MSDGADGATVRLRALALWTSVTLSGAALGAIALPPAGALATAPGQDFATLLVQVCALVALVAMGALWLLTSDVVRQVLAPGSPGPHGAPGAGERPGPLRTLLLTACGVVVMSSTTALPAFAHDGPDAPLTSEVLEGLPLPDRAVGAGPSTTPVEHPVTPPVDLPDEQPANSEDEPSVVRVRPGDSLWVIAARELGPSASNADLAAYWRQIHAANGAAIGPNPDLIQPDQHLHLPRH